LSFYLASMSVAPHTMVEPPDVALARDVGRAIARPRLDPADSFVLHAPLELAARFALLPFVDPTHRDDARRRLRELADAYDDAGPAVGDPPPRDFTSPTDAARRLAEAIDAGDLDETDACACWLGDHVDGTSLRGLLADVVVPRLAAAAHGSILLYQLPRVAPRGELPTGLLRPLARELARQPGWRIEWVDHPRRHERADVAPDADLFDAIAGTPALGSPGSDFIFPVMHQVDATGTAASVLDAPIGTADVVAGGRAVLRAAAWSMLHEPDDHTPYGWTHCLTLPQAVLGVAGACRSPRTAMAVAATHVVGFRAAFAREPLVASFAAPDPRIDVATALREQPDVAAAASWHAEPSTRPDVVATLVSHASVHHDAHYVKYTLACLDAAHADPDCARLYLTAAARLAGYWAAR